MYDLKGRIGLALGSGAARGWAHVGVIRALEERGIVPDIVCGSSAGALVGAMYAAGRLEGLEKFGQELDWRQMVGYFDVSLRGGLIRARKLLATLTAEFGSHDLASLGKPFGCVATDLVTGREIWLREGPLFERVQASMALPGLVAPVRLDGRWLVDGGLVNAVPISLCRAMGAETVIAVDLDTTLIGRHRAAIAAAAGETTRRSEPAAAPPEAVAAPEPERSQDAEEGAEEDAEAAEREALEAALLALPGGAPLPRSLVEERGEADGANALQGFVNSMWERIGRGGTGEAREPSPREPQPPSIYEVVGTALSIMQVRLTRSRMAGDPPELLITPKLQDFWMLDFDRAQEAIAEGRRAVARALADHPIA